MPIQQKALKYEHMNITPGEPVRVTRRPHVMDDREIQSLHTHSCMEFGYCERGSGIFIVNDQIIPFREGDITIMVPGDYHRAKSSPGIVSEWRWIWADVASCIRGGGSFAAGVEHESLLNLNPASSALHDAPGLLRILREITTEMTAQSTHYKTAVQALMLRLAILLHRRFGNVEVRESTVNRHRSAVQPALEHILGGYSGVIRIEQLASLCHMSLSSFRAKFKSATGLTPVTYVNSIRLKMSEALLLNTDRPIIDISSETGFRTLSSLNRLFKRTHGISPRQFRKQGRSR